MPADGRAISVITIARELITDPTKWCQYVPAQLADGTRTEASDPLACRWCASGAIEVAAAGHEQLFVAAKGIVDETVRAVYADERWKTKLGMQMIEKEYWRLWQVNDFLGHAAALDIMDKAVS